mmetsp:Transcript_8359/g.20060  ORF Transcript_8359/g.20060 Transcript_8359/m.20060 type:complete len:231 (+) Transcript_8359:1676-2368(+)
MDGGRGHRAPIRADSPRRRPQGVVRVSCDDLERGGGLRPLRRLPRIVLLLGGRLRLRVAPVVLLDRTQERLVPGEEDALGGRRRLGEEAGSPRDLPKEDELPVEPYLNHPRSALAVDPALVVVPDADHPKLGPLVEGDADPVGPPLLEGREPHVEVVARHVDPVHELVRGPRVRLVVRELVDRRGLRGDLPLRGAHNDGSAGAVEHLDAAKADVVRVAPCGVDLELQVAA